MTHLNEPRQHCRGSTHFLGSVIACCPKAENFDTDRYAPLAGRSIYQVIFGNLLADDHQGLSANDWLSTMEQLVQGCVWQFDPEDKRNLASGQRACQWHKPVHSWHDIDPLVNPSQQPGPTELGGRVFWLEWQNGPDNSLLLILRPPIKLTDNENGLCQFMLSEKKVLLSPDSQVVLDWDQASISFPDFIEQICHPNDHDRIAELLLSRCRLNTTTAFIFVSSVATAVSNMSASMASSPSTANAGGAPSKQIRSCCPNCTAISTP